MITAGSQRWVGRPLAVRPPAVWAWFIAGCGVLIVGYQVLPLTEGWLSLIYSGLAGLGALALAAGVARHRPAVWSAWALLAAGQFVYTLADTVYYLSARGGEPPYPGPADLLYLLSYPLLAAGVGVLVRRRTPGWQLATVVDATILGVAATLLWWVYLMRPLTAARGGPILEQTVSTAYLALDLLLFICALRLMIGTGLRTPAFYLILASFGLMIAADGIYALRNAAGTWQDYTWVDSIWLGSYALLGAAGLHPSMRRLHDRSAAAAPGASAPRMAALVLASLVGPGVLLIEYFRGRDHDVPFIAIACALMFLLVLGRMAGLVAAQRHDAMTDALTGLYARRFFEENLRVEIERAHRSGTRVGLLLIDADHFKRINDTYGHPGGDRVLVELARRLRTICRPGDIVARIGGEEFALLLLGAGPARATQMAERVRRFVSATPFLIDETAFRQVTVSVGVAVLPGDGQTSAELVQTADRALYAAKRAGRDRVVGSDTVAAHYGTHPAAGCGTHPAAECGCHPAEVEFSEPAA